MKRKLLVGFVTMVMALTFMVAPAFAAVLSYDTAATTTWGKNGGAGIDEYILKLQDLGVAAEDAAKITTVSVTIDMDTDSFKPQFIINSEKGGWNQLEVEFTTPGLFTYDHPVNGKFTADSGWNEFWIQSGWKNEGKADIVSIEFKDADGNVIYAEGVEAGEVAVEETAADDAAATDAAADDTAVPQTGVVGLGLVYGLGALATGAVALKKRNK